MCKIFNLLLLAGWQLLAFPAIGVSPALGDEDNRPNIILINLDDADVDLFRPELLQSHFPNINRLANEGIRFSNFHITTPVCGPSRACLFRGQYAHRCGIKVNDTIQTQANGFRGGLFEYQSRGYDQNDLPVWMQSAGYHTALIGKYVNNGEPTYVPEGWDEFYASMGSRYYGTSQFTTRSNPQGERSFRALHEYRTNVETVDCLQLLNKHAFSDSGKPFFFYVAPFAPHAQSAGKMYDERFEHWWPNAKLPNRPDFDEVDFSDKPAHLQKLARLTPEDKERIRQEYRHRLLAMVSVDRMIAQLRIRLENLGLLDNTYIILTSDNGYQLGHHRMLGKLAPYDRVTKVPLIVWGPDVQPLAGANHLLANIDLAPTLVEMAGGTVPAFVDGKSFKSLIDDPTSVTPESWRFGLLIENWQDGFSFGNKVDSSYVALRMYSESYIEHSNGEREFYDLAIDPFQVRNRYTALNENEIVFFRNVMRELKWNPVAAITTVSDNAEGNFTSRTLKLNGVAEHREGVDHLRLAIRNQETGQYWDGLQWKPDFFANLLDPASPEGQLADWNFDFLPSNLDQDFGRLVVSARPVDINGQVGHPFVYRITIDTERPDTEIRTPGNGLILSRPLNITGFAYDRSPIREVRLVIKNIETGLFFDGEKLVEGRTTINVAPRSRTFWIQPINPPAGRYWFSARAYDAAGNFDLTPATGTFRVE